MALRSGRDKVANGVGRLENFKQANVSGRWYPDGDQVPTGRLPLSEAVLLRRTHGPVYVAFSYQTPIAWRRAGGPWYMPQVRYSVTTANHQSAVLQGMREWDRRTGRAVAEVLG